MTKDDKRFAKLRNNPKNIRFADLCKAAESVGFRLQRQTGSHRIYDHPANADLMLNLQPIGKQAKAYQVRDFLEKVDRYNLHSDG